MASFTGVVGFPDVEYDEETWNAGFGQKNTVALDQALAESTLSTVGSYTDQNPLDLNTVAQIGTRAGDQFGWLDWYDRIHIQYTLLDLGNLLSTQVVTIEVFSTYFEDRTLTDVVGVNDSGLTLTPPSAYPMTFLPWDSELFSLQISTSGPPTIDATYTFDFDVIDLELRVIGTRIVVWSFHPDWQRPILERLEWMTSVARAYDGSEQRMKLRTTGPRWEFEFSFNLHGNAEATLLENYLYDWQSRVWAMPVFTDGTTLTAAASGTNVPCDTTTRDFHAGGLALLSSADGHTYESFEIQSVADGVLTAVLPITGTWPAGSGIFPLRNARLTARMPLQRLTAAGLEGVASFRCVEPIVRTAATETTYRGYPVMTERPNWREGLPYEYTRAQDEFDNRTHAEPVVDDGAGSIPIQSWLWSAFDRTEIETLRRFLFARMGRWKAIWLPTFTNDLRLAAGLTSAQVNMDVEWCGLTAFVQEGAHRRDVRIELKDGTVFYRRVSGFVQVDADTERMTLASALGQAVDPDDVAMISWLMLARLDQDAVEITWYTPGAAEAQLAFAGFNNDV